MNRFEFDLKIEYLSEVLKKMILKVMDSNNIDTEPRMRVISNSVKLFNVRQAKKGLFLRSACIAERKKAC